MKSNIYTSFMVPQLHLGNHFWFEFSFKNGWTSVSSPKEIYEKKIEYYEN